MNKKYLFFDADGTLIGNSRHISENTFQALEAARQNGHAVFLSTGRAFNDLSSELLAIPFDGMILASGAHVVLDGKTVFEKPMRYEDYHGFIEKLIQRNIGFVLEGLTNLHLYGSAVATYQNYLQSYLEDKSEEEKRVHLSNKHLFLFSEITPEDYQHVLKITLYPDSKKDAEYVLSILPSNFWGYYATDFGHYMCEIMLKDVNKSTGVQVVINQLGAKQEDTISFGDSMNDLAMLQFTKISVAMENAPEAVKKAADFVTKPADDDGISYALKYFGLI